MNNPFRIINHQLPLLMILAAFLSPIFAQKQQSEIDDAPVLNYEAETQKSVSRERQEKNKRLDSKGSFVGYGHSVIAELPKGVEPLKTITHWWIGLPALPVEQSTAVVMGEVIEAEAHLSDDRTAIYSDFTIRVEKIFKDTSSLIALSSPLSANRLGGNVRFASGRVNKYRIAKQGMPQIKERYLLFLKQSEGGDFWIITGYKLSNGNVTPLDGEENKDPRGALPFAKYRGAKKTQILQDLRNVFPY